METGTSTTEVVTQKGNSSKPISVYAQGETTHPIKSSSVGLKINISNLTLDGSFGLDNTGLFASYTTGNQINSLGLRVDFSNVKVGIEFSTAIQWDSTTQTNYANVSVSGWWILATYLAATSGQSMPQPDNAY